MLQSHRRHSGIRDRFSRPLSPRPGADEEDGHNAWLSSHVCVKYSMKKSLKCMAANFMSISFFKKLI